MIRLRVAIAAALAAILTPTAALRRRGSRRRPSRARPCWCRACKARSAAPSAQEATCTSSKALPVVSRVSIPRPARVTTFASGLPAQVVPGAGGATDVEFLGGTAYVLVQFIGTYLGGPDEVNGIYRVDGPNTFTVVADIGAFNVANPPDTDFELPTGVQTSFQAFRGGFLVTDGHLNRMLRVTLDGDISVFRAFDNIVPVGLETWGNRIYMAQAGPLPHLPADGKIVSFTPKSSTATEVAAGGPLLVDVERGRGTTLYGLAQGIWPPGTWPEIRQCRTPASCSGSTATAPSPSSPMG